MFCMACGTKTAAFALFCSKACNDRQATDPFCPSYDVATGLREVKCRGCNADLSRPGDLLGIQTTNGVSCIKCLGKMLDFLRTVPQTTVDGCRVHGTKRDRKCFECPQAIEEVQK